MRNVKTGWPLRALAAAVLVAVASVPARAQDDPTGSWSPEASSQKFLQGGAASDGVYLYVVGGDQEDGIVAFPQYFRKLRRYDPVADSWSQLSDFPFPVHSNAVAYHSGRLFSFGGVNLNDTTTALIAAYDIATPGWSLLAATLSEPRFDLAAAALGDRIHIVGGVDVPFVRAAHDEFDPAMNTVAVRAPLPAARAALTATGAAGRLYAVGGQIGGAAMSDTYEYDPATDGWTSRAAAPLAHQWARSFELQGRVYVTGGFNGGALNSNYEYNPATDTWASRATLAAARYLHGAGAIAGKGYIYGGTPNGATMSGAEYTPPVFAPPPPSNGAPTANAGPDQTVEAASLDGAVVTLDGSGSTDPDEGDVLTYAWSPVDASGPNPNVTLPIGEHVLTLTVSDGEATSTDTVVITVEDTEAPVVSGLTASPNVLWSPNKDMRQVVLTFTASDAGDPAPECEIIGVCSNQPTGDEEDWQVTGAMTLNLRAERSNGQSRVYTVTVRCTDSSGNSSLAEVTVCVPHSQGGAGIEAQKAK